jgi:hypothetical protein
MMMQGSKIIEAAILSTRQMTEGHKPTKGRNNPPNPIKK